MLELKNLNEDEIIFKNIGKKIKRNEILFSSVQEIEGEFIYYKIFPKIVDDMFKVNNNKTTYFSYYKNNKDIHFIGSTKLDYMFKKISVLPLTNIDNCDELDVVKYLSSSENTKINYDIQSDIITYKNSCYFIELTPILLIKDNIFKMKDVLILPFLDINLRKILKNINIFK